MGSRSSRPKDGTKAPKQKKEKKRKEKNNPRHAGSTQSLNIDHAGVVSPSPYPNQYSQLEDTRCQSWHQSTESLPVQANPRGPPPFKPPPVPGDHQENRTNAHSQFQTFDDFSGQDNPSIPPRSKPPPSHNKQTLTHGKDAPEEDDDYLKEQKGKSVYHKTELSKRLKEKPDVKNVYDFPESNSRPKVRADRNYESNHETDISFRKGDILQLINEGEFDGWYFVRNVTTKQEGYVHKNWVTMITNDDVQSQKCFFNGMTREDAEEKLQDPRIEIGTYALRPSEDDYALSLRCETELYELEIRHYKVRVVDKGICYIDADTKSKPFSNIAELIKYYTEKPGLRCRLKTPLPPDIPLKSLAVKFSDLKLGEKLGSGNFGSVYAATLHNNRQVAVKSLKAGGSMTVEEFMEEAETMHKLRHPKLVSLLAICEDRGKIYIVTERMSKGALLTLLREDSGNTIKFKDLMDQAIQVVEGMCYLERKGFVHRDLRAANVLVGDGNITKIADFGLARLLDNYYEHEEFYQEQKGSLLPYKWTAPEAIKQLKFTVKSDVWSFGILLYEMVTYGDEPYAAMSNPEVLAWLKNGKRLEKPTDQRCPMTLYNIMKQCWLINSNDRPNFADIKETLVEIKTSG